MLNAPESNKFHTYQKLWDEHLATHAPPLSHDNWYHVIVYSRVSGWYVVNCLVLASAFESKWDAKIPVRYVRRIHGVITTEVRRNRIFYTKEEAEEYLSVTKYQRNYFNNDQI